MSESTPLPLTTITPLLTANDYNENHSKNLLFFNARMFLVGGDRWTMEGSNNRTQMNQQSDDLIITELPKESICTNIKEAYSTPSNPVRLAPDLRTSAQK